MTSPPLLRAFRVVAIAWLVTAYFKVDLYLTILDEARLYPVVEHPLFPSVFSSGLVVTLAYWAPLAAAPLLALSRRGALMVLAAVLLASSFLLGWSLDTHNDATWITGFWSALWLLWLSTQSARTDAAVFWEAIGLAQLVVALCFLGGTVGKLTDGYLNGDVLRQIYLERKGNFPWPALREALSEDGKQTLMVWFSRVTIVMEGSLIFVPFVRLRLGCRLAIVAMAGVVAISHITLSSVMACLVGLMVAALLLLREVETHRGGHGPLDTDKVVGDAEVKPANQAASA